MKKLLEFIIVVLQRDPLLFTALLAASFIMAAGLSCVPGFLMIPCVRLVLHAVAAFVITLFYNMLGLAAILVGRELLGVWFATCAYMNIINDDCARYMRKRVKRIFMRVCPFLGTLAYIKKCYQWEVWQADYYSRNIQLAQLTMDIVFAIVACVVWSRFFNRFSQVNYWMNLPKAINWIENKHFWLASIEIFYDERKNRNASITLQTIYFSVMLSIPIWILPIFVILVANIDNMGVWNLA